MELSIIQNSIDTEKFSAQLRRKAINIAEKRILLTRFSGSDQEKDLSEPANCNGYGRIRHFIRDRGSKWPLNPLPIDPVSKAFGLTKPDSIRAQVFQNSVCNWRCWYCFVDFALLSGDENHADWFTCDEMLDMYLAQDAPPLMIDLTGGQPDLTPEWVPWMIEAIKRRGLETKIYLWSDDNLSNDYFWRFLTDTQISMLAHNNMYSRVCCFKGIDELSFALNTKADPSLFSNQFNLCKKLVDVGIDLYFYITLTAPSSTDFNSVIPKFIDKLQSISDQLPLRMVPLQIGMFTPVQSRMNDTFHDMLKGQYSAVSVWNTEIEKRFSQSQRSINIADVKL